ncbi:hypothetical protein [Lichenicoccus sp.]|uniref:hypothetical protein n=1 Tax=Lichenicoccus sp. TaxID=2781899 RepID=UPI003D116441
MTARARGKLIQIFPPFPINAVFVLMAPRGTTSGRVQHTARMLNASEVGSEASALACCIFEIAINKDWAAEALVYNALAQGWTKLLDRAVALYDARAGSPQRARV